MPLTQLLPVVGVLCLTIKPSQSNGVIKAPGVAVTVCPLSLTELGRTAGFRFNFIYRVTTRPDGSVEKIAEIHKHHGAEFVRTDRIVECLKAWRLEPSAKHLVTFSVGTTGGPNQIVVKTERQPVKLLLP